MSSLSESDKRALLALARGAIKCAVREEQLPSDLPREGIFAGRRGVFVTLRCKGRLRGCIGVIDPAESLGESVTRCAVSAALEDPRFPAVRAEELPELRIEISLLTRPRRITPDRIEIGHHGLLVCQGPLRGLLLPQVAAEYGLTREEFLEETCRKAFLPVDAWKDPDTEICAFSCEILAEDE